MIVKLNFQEFQLRFFKTNTVFVYTTDKGGDENWQIEVIKEWNFFTAQDHITIWTVKEKFEDSTENIIWIERYLNSLPTLIFVDEVMDAEWELMIKEDIEDKQEFPEPEETEEVKDEQ